PPARVAGGLEDDRSTVEARYGGGPGRLAAEAAGSAPSTAQAPELGLRAARLQASHDDLPLACSTRVRASTDPRSLSVRGNPSQRRGHRRAAVQQSLPSRP